MNELKRCATSGAGDERSSHFTCLLPLLLPFPQSTWTDKWGDTGWRESVTMCRHVPICLHPSHSLGAELVNVVRVAANDFLACGCAGERRQTRKQTSRRRRTPSLHDFREVCGDLDLLRGVNGLHVHRCCGCKCVCVCMCAVVRKVGEQTHTRTHVKRRTLSERKTCRNPQRTLAQTTLPAHKSPFDNLHTVQRSGEPLHWAACAETRAGGDRDRQGADVFLQLFSTYFSGFQSNFSIQKQSALRKPT